MQNKSAAGKGLKTIAGALFTSKDKSAVRALKQMILGQQPLAPGNDAIVLTAVAARRAGGGLWQMLRKNRNALISRQGYAGDVVVLLSRLDGCGDW